MIFPLISRTLLGTRAFEVQSEDAHFREYFWGYSTIRFTCPHFTVRSH